MLTIGSKSYNEIFIVEMMGHIFSLKGFEKIESYYFTVNKYPQSLPNPLHSATPQTRDFPGETQQC